MDRPPHSPPPSEAPRFVVDVMLGRLARWLRLLGFDTAYDCHWDDKTIARLSVREQRIVLTRDRGLLARRMVRRGLLVDADDLETQLQIVAAAFRLDLRAGPRFTRCTFCNTPLEEISPDQARGAVPPYVLRTQRRFTRCPDCGRIYWRGTHAALAASHLGGQPT